MGRRVDDDEVSPPLLHVGDLTGDRLATESCDVRRVVLTSPAPRDYGPLRIGVEDGDLLAGNESCDGQRADCVAFACPALLGKYGQDIHFLAS